MDEFSSAAQAAPEEGLAAGGSKPEDDQRMKPLDKL
jgi:hypothetical protein